MAPPSDVFDSSFLRNSDDLSALYLAMLKGGLNKPSRDDVGRAAAGFVRTRLKGVVPNADSRPLSDSDRAVLKTLQRNGVAFCPDVFSPADIAEIKKFSLDKMVDISGYGQEAVVPFAHVPPNANFAHFRFKDLGRCAPIYKLIHNQQLIELMARYLGAPPTIGIVTLWWSYAPPGPPEGMQMYHHDRGDFRSCNLFTYLTDVDMGTGPHAYVERTHETQILAPLAAQRFANNPEAHAKFWQWMEEHRKTDEGVSSFFPKEDIKFHTGPAGTSFLEDTRGLHKGTRPTTGPRMAFEIFYSIMPKYNETITPLKRADLDLPPDINIPTDQLDPLVRYATRQFFV